MQTFGPRSRAVLGGINGEYDRSRRAFDVVLAEPDRLSPADAAVLRAAGAEVALPPGVQDGDAAFADALARGHTVAGAILTPEGGSDAPAPVAGFATVGPDATALLPDLGGAVANLPRLRARAAGVGVVCLLPEADGVVQRVPLVACAGDQILPGLSVEALRVAQGAGAITLRTVDGPPPAMAALRVGDFATPTDAWGRLWLHPSGLPDMPRLSAAKVALDAPERWADAVTGRIVLVGTSAAGLREIVATSLAGGVPGVEVHAEAIDEIAAGDVLARPDWARGAESDRGALGVLAVVAALPVGSAAGGAAMATLEVDRMRVKGRVEPVTVHAVLGDAALARGFDFTALRAAQAEWIATHRGGDPAGAVAALSRLRAREPLAPPPLVALQRQRAAALAATDADDAWDGVYAPEGKAPTG